MSIRLVFADGSNPYIKYNLSPVELAREILKWSKRFELRYLETSGGTILHFEATEKG